MSFYPTATIIAALKARLEAMPLDAGQPAGPKLFELVAYYKASDIARAFADLYIAKDRVCLIVPVGFRHFNDRDRLMIKTSRELTVDLLIGDRAFDKGAMTAFTGPAGVLEMAERIIDDFFATPLDLADCQPEPEEGAPLLLTSDERPNDPGRVCWIQTLRLRAGLSRGSVAQ